MEKDIEQIVADIVKVARTRFEDNPEGYHNEYKKALYDVSMAVDAEIGVLMFNECHPEE